jgi:hypothetical protein
MEISTSPAGNASQSLALSAYTAQQQGVERSRERENDNQSVDRSRADDTRRRSDVTFSPEALRLSAQATQQVEERSTVNRSSESTATDRQQQQASRPELERAAGADTVAQAINAYRSTSIV